MIENVLEITSHTRLVVTQEQNPESPRREGECICGTYTPPSWWGHKMEGPLPMFDHPGNIVEADDRLYARGSWEPDRMVQRWSQTFYGLELLRFGGTYWYCDATAFADLHGGPFDIEHQRAVIIAEHNHYESYLRGESKVITLQRLAEFRRVTRKYHDKQEDLLTVWETIGETRDQYLDTDYAEADVAFEFFWADLTRKEKTIVTAMLDERRAERALQDAAVRP